MGKSSYHKSENTFKFQSFSARIANVNIDVIHKIRHHDDTPEETSTYFCEALEKWTELNCTQHFTDFRRQISQQVQTLTQLVHHKEDIVKALRTHLSIPESLAYEPLLDLLVQLARDLQKDFYSYFQDFFELLVSLLSANSQKAELIEQLFSTLSYLFKFLWRYLVQDIQNVYKYFSTLLKKSNKEYLVNFAAESFAYLMRKVKNHGELFDFLFLTLVDSPETVNGVGRLVFEMFKSVQKQFHSCTEKVFPILLSKVGECQEGKMVQLPWELVEEAVTHVFVSMAKHTDKKNSSSMWRTLMASTEHVYQCWTKSSKKNKEKISEHFLRLLRLVNVWLKFRSVVVSESELIAQTLLTALQGGVMPPEVGDELIQVVSSLLTAGTDLTVATTVKLVSSVFRTKYQPSTVYTFVRSLMNLPIFEKDVLPSLLPYCHHVMCGKDKHLQDLTTHLLTDIILHKAPPPNDGSQLEGLQTYMLDFGPQKRCGLPDHLMSVLKSSSKQSHLSDTKKFAKVWSTLILLPHVRPFEEKKEAMKCVSQILQNASKLASISSSSEFTDLLLYLMYHCVLAMIYIQEDGELFELTPVSFIKDILNCHCDNIYSLKLSDLYFTQASLDGSTGQTAEEVLLEIYLIIEKNLSSPHSQVRMLTLRILSQFDLRLPSQDVQSKEQLDVFRICLEAELVPLTVQDYRRKLMFLQRLQCDIVHNALPIGPFTLVPLRFLIGALFINFKLLWEPITKLIASHALGLDKNTFWALYSQFLQTAAQKSEESLYLDPTLTPSDNMDLNFDEMETTFRENCASHKEAEKPDHVNFRFHLWKAMHLFSDLCEMKNRDIVPMIFDFLNKEYYSLDLQEAPSQNIRRSKSQRSEVETEEVSEEEDLEEDCRITRSSAYQKKVLMSEMDVDEEEDVQEQCKMTRSSARQKKDSSKKRNSESENDVATNEETKKAVKQRNKSRSMGNHSPNNTEEGQEQGSRKKRKAATSALLVHLELFSKFKNPKSVYMEAELANLYQKLLLHKDGRVQKVAFDCIMTYKHKYLVSYRENFENLLDDSKFKTEIVLFSIDDENSIIHPEHRDQVLSVLMRILYGKMHSKTGKDTAGKSHSQFRRSIVFRFLNGCHGDELVKFMDMVFEPFKQFIQDDVNEMINKVEKELDISKVIPLRKMAGAINTIDMIMKKLGHLIESYLPSLHSVILGLTATCVTCLENRVEVSPSAVKTLKNLRQLCIAQIQQFYEMFDSYKYSPKEIDGMFRVAVWPQLPMLSSEGIYHPTPLLKLLHICATNKRYMTLLAKCNDNDMTLTPISMVLKLLNANGVHQNVADFIVEMLDTLLGGGEDEDIEAITIATPVKINKMVEINDITEFGSELLKPHVSEILQYIQRAIKNMKLGAKKSKAAGKELSILSRISEFVNDKIQCVALIELLLPFLNEGMTRAPQTELNILNSITNLLSKVDDNRRFYRPFCQLFSYIHIQQSRILLCQLIQIIADSNIDLQSIAHLVTELNAWDPKHVEEPDYMRRLNAHKRVNETVRSMEDKLDIDFLIPVLHCCCFCIKKVDDMSLRDNSTHTLVTMVRQFSHVTYDQDAFRELISHGLILEVKAGFRNKSENVRHEFIAILSVLVETFPTHDMFADLVQLEDKDVEADFFENIRHIQTHRRSRALKKMNKLLRLHPVRKEILVSYLLPVTTSFLTDEIFTKAQGLQESAVDSIGVLCKQLPWHLYMNQLNFFLSLLSKKLEKQKLFVRVIVGILDAFHFDLRNSEYCVVTLPDAITKQKAKGEITEEPNQLENDEESNVEHTESESSPTVPENVDITDETMETDSTDNKDPNDMVICSASQATRIHLSILRKIIPNLHRCLTRKEKSEGEHKLAKSNLAEDSEVLRVPIALAMIKLLQNLPKKSLEHNLPGILLKVCNFLRSRATDIRNTARDTLTKITSSLGPKYFPFILSELRGTLRKGYQVHVLCFTVYVLLKNLLPTLKPGDLDLCRKSLQDVFHEDLFGQVAEEKEVAAVTGKLLEAKAVKSYESYQMLAKVLSREALMAFITPLKEILDTTHSHTIARKVQEVFRKIVTGLLDNQGLTTETLMIFTHGLITQSFPQLVEQQVKKPKEDDGDKNSLRPPSCLLLPETPKRGGEKPKSSKKTNIHVLVEFGLHLLSMALKRSRLVLNKEEHRRLADPFIPVIADCLYSKHIKINTLSLRCLCWLLKFHLPSTENNITKLANGMFIILKTYASAGSSKGDNFELISMAFKAVTVLVRDVKIYQLQTGQLQVLLSFCEEDLYDYNRQSTAFSLLKAILTRKLDVPEVKELISKVENMSITNDLPHVRRECRQIALQYILEYPLGKRLTKHLEFYVTQLSYELEMGRESALEMLATIFSSFPQNILNEQAGMFFIPMSAALVNDESTKCRKLTALAIKSLLEKIDHNTRNDMFSITQKWFSDDQITHRILAAQLSGLFIEVESIKFKHRLSAVLPILQQQIEPGRYEENSKSDSETDRDHLLFNCLNTLTKLLRECSIVRDIRWNQEMNIIWESVQSHLRHAHMWVRLASCQLIGLLFTAWSPDEIVDPKSSKKMSFITDNPVAKVESLAIDLISQLQSQYLTEELATQIIKNMVFIAKVAKCLKNISEHDTGGDPGKKEKKLSLPWLIRKMVREANHEAVTQAKVTIKRSSVFKWIAAVSLDLGAQMLSSVVPIMMPALQRETNENNTTSDPALKTLAQEVLDILKKILGVETFTQLYAETHKQQFDKKESRKRKQAVEAVANPAYAAKRKMKKNLAKRDSKKRKIEEFRVSKKIKKRKTKNVVDAS